MKTEQLIVRQDLFGTQSLIVPAESILQNRLEESREIIAKAIIDNQPYAICLMLSGGDDSITALQAALMLGVKIDFIIHGITGTGLPEVLRYVIAVAERVGIPVIYADAGDAFVKYVVRKGFFGKGTGAHQFAYHILKRDPFNAAISEHMRKRIVGRTIVLLNGVRVEESDNRADNYGDDPYRWDGNNLWVNIIHWWTKKECLELLAAESIERSPIAIALGRSGECMCGTMQSEADRIAASEFNPEWGAWMQSLRREVTRLHGWDIGQNPSKKALEERKAAATQLPGFMPMCIGCKARNPNQQQLFGDDNR